MPRTEWLTLPDACIRAGVSWAVMWRQILTGAVEARRVRGRWHIQLDSLEHWIAARATAESAPLAS